VKDNHHLQDFTPPPLNRRSGGFLMRAMTEIIYEYRHQCQYCGSKKHLTIDHIIPRSKGRKHSWDNVAIACARCNSRTSDRTPQQAGISLKTKPQAPAHPAIAFAEVFWQTTVIKV
jgi:5-methylcytosine-specific restriction endonuclease McrA